MAFEPLDFPLLAATETSLPKPGDWVVFLFQNSSIGYTLPAIKVNTRHVKQAFFRSAHLRSPGRIENSFANESFIDKIAFAAKAAPGYYYAKEIIKFINALADQINNDPRVRDRIKIVFMENYGVTLAEKIIPASEVSEQISTTTKEASGTSNMKFMMNGAITLATLDGANVEILEEVGNPNIVIFGMAEKEVLDYYRNDGYVSREIYTNDERVKRVMDSLTNGTIKGINVEGTDIFRSLIDYNDEFFVLKDFDSYLKAQKKIEDLYNDRFTWNKMAIENISSSGVFSADVTVMQYASGIWDTRIIER